MTLEPFRFSLEPKLVSLGAERDTQLHRLTAIEADLEAAENATLEAVRKTQTTAQRIRGAHDDLTSPATEGRPGWELASRARHLEALNARLAGERQEVATRQEEERVLRAVLAANRDHLGRIEATLDALERKKAVEEKRHRKALEKREDQERNDDCILRHGRNHA